MIKLADDDVKVKLAVIALHLPSMKSVPKSCPSVKPLADLRESLEYWYNKSKISYEYVV
jgi:23S rRNA (adenine2503-C2)-methyltransferase